MITDVRELTLVMAISSLVLVSICYSQSKETNSVENAKPIKLEQCVPQSVYSLFYWPDLSTIDKSKCVSSDSAEVAWPKKQCFEWLKKVIDPAWMPPEDVNEIFIRDEFDGRDVVRMHWQRKGFDIKVSQTASIFTIKLTPLGNKNVGIKAQEKIENAKQLCIQVFTKVGYRWGQDKLGTGIKVPVKNLSEKITTYSFKPELINYLSDDNAIFGRSKLMEEAGVKSPKDDAQALKEIDPNNPNWDSTAYSYNYWFRTIHWFNDEKSVGFFFLKIDGGSWLPSYNAKFDKNFFQVREQKK